MSSGNYTVYKRGHQGAVINTWGIETDFERSVNRVIVSLSRDAMHKLKRLGYIGKTSFPEGGNGDVRRTDRRIAILLERPIYFECN